MSPEVVAKIINVSKGVSLVSTSVTAVANIYIGVVSAKHQAMINDGLKKKLAEQNT